MICHEDICSLSLLDVPFLAPTACSVARVLALPTSLSAVVTVSVLIFASMYILHCIHCNNFEFLPRARSGQGLVGPCSSQLEASVSSRLAVAPAHTCTRGCAPSEFALRHCSATFSTASGPLGLAKNRNAPRQEMLVLRVQVLDKLCPLPEVRAADVARGLICDQPAHATTIALSTPFVYCTSTCACEHGAT